MTWPVLAWRDGALVRIDRAVHFEVTATRVADGPSGRGRPRSRLDRRARSRHCHWLRQHCAPRSMRACHGQTSIATTRIVWEGADAAAIDRAGPGARIIRMPVPAPPSAAADAVREALRAVSPRPERFEPVMLTPEQLSSWSRQPGSPPANAPLRDEGDRRWLWGIVLAAPGSRSVDATSPFGDRDASQMTARYALPDPALTTTLSRVRRRWRLRLFARAAAIGGAAFALALVLSLSAFDASRNTALVDRNRRPAAAQPCCSRSRIAGGRRSIRPRRSSARARSITSSSPRRSSTRDPRPIAAEIRQEIDRQAAERLGSVDIARVIPLAQPVGDRGGDPRGLRLACQRRWRRHRHTRGNGRPLERARRIGPASFKVTVIATRLHETSCGSSRSSPSRCR